MQERDEVFHEGEFGLGAGFPAEVERGHEVAQLARRRRSCVAGCRPQRLAGRRWRGRACWRWSASSCGILFRLEAGVAVADGRFAEAFARFQGGDVGGDVLALVHELGIGLDQADELLAAHLLLARRLLGEAGDEPHDVVVVNDGGGEEDELEIELVHAPALGLSVAFALLGLEALGGLQIGATEAEQVVLGQDLLDGGCVVVGEVGVLVELGLEPLHFLEALDEGGAGVVALEVGHGLRGAVEALRLHEGVELLHGVLQFLDDHGGLVHQPDFAGLSAGIFAGEESDGGIDGVLLLAEVEDVAVGLGVVEHAVGAGEGLNQAVVLEVLVHVERVEVLGVEAGEQHVDHDGDVDLLRMRGRSALGHCWSLMRFCTS